MILSRHNPERKQKPEINLRRVVERPERRKDGFITGVEEVCQRHDYNSEAQRLGQFVRRYDLESAGFLTGTSCGILRAADRVDYVPANTLLREVMMNNLELAKIQHAAQSEQTEIVRDVVRSFLVSPALTMCGIVGPAAREVYTILHSTEFDESMLYGEGAHTFFNHNIGEWVRKFPDHEYDRLSMDAQFADLFAESRVGSIEEARRRFYQLQGKPERYDVATGFWKVGADDGPLNDIVQCHAIVLEALWDVPAARIVWGRFAAQHQPSDAMQPESDCMILLAEQAVQVVEPRSLETTPEMPAHKAI